MSALLLTGVLAVAGGGTPTLRGTGAARTSGTSIGHATGTEVSSAARPNVVPFSGAPSSECPQATAGPQFYAPPVRGAAKTVALTFDDGPGPSTQAIIDILERFHVRATFMNIGDQEEEWPSLVREEADDGFLIGDHTLTHPDLLTLDPVQQANEVDAVVHLDRRLVATSPCVFRPPYGDYDASVLSLVNSRRMTLWMWSVDTQDWMAEGSGSSYWVHRIIGLAESEGGALDHPVVLMHNQAIAMPATVAALPTVIRFFRQHGYVFVDLLGRTGPPGSCGSGPMPRTAGVALATGSTLQSGHDLRTRTGEFSLEMRSDGDLAVIEPGGAALWSTGTAGHPGARLTVGANGDVQLRTAAGRLVWSTRTAGHPGARLVLGDDGALAVERGGETLWSDGAPATSLAAGERLEAGWELSSSDGRCRLTEQPSGGLVLRDEHNQVLFRTATSARAAFVALTTAGDLELRSELGALLWRSATSGAALQLKVLDTGQLAIVGRGGTRRWVTP